MVEGGVGVRDRGMVGLSGWGGCRSKIEGLLEYVCNDIIKLASVACDNASITWLFLLSCWLCHRGQLWALASCIKCSQTIRLYRRTGRVSASGLGCHPPSVL